MVLQGLWLDALERVGMKNPLAREGRHFNLRIQLLGGFTVSVNGQLIPQEMWRSRRARNLVKLLALSPNHRLHRDQVIESFWPNSKPAYQTNNLYQSLHAARLVLDAWASGCFVLQEGVLSLSCGAGGSLTVDVDEFCLAATRARESQEAGLYQSALALYGGELLPDDRYEEWTLRSREEYRRTYLGLLLDLAQLQEKQLDYQAGMETLQRVLDIDKTCDEAHAGLMRLLTLSGQRQRALRQFQELCDILSRELELRPSPSTVRLYESIQAGQLAPAASPSRASHNLPQQLTPLIGRENEVEALQEMVLSNQSRLVTVLGAGGVGKTRLALEVGRNLQVKFADGIYLVELEAGQGGVSLTTAITQVIGLGHSDSALYTAISHDRSALDEDLVRLAVFLDEKRILLILDGFEHRIKEVRLVLGLLQRTPRLKILVTSRVQLNLEVEQIYQVDGLAYPADRYGDKDLSSYAALRLFVSAAQRKNPEFRLDSSNQLAIAEICRLTQGIPLGILLAAGWAEMMAPGQIVDQIRRNLDFLAMDRLDLPDRQRSLRATFDYSWQLLGEAEQKAFTSLAVFNGSFSAESASQVGEFSLPTLRMLLAHSMLIQSGAGRFGMHELLHQYALEKLAANPAKERALRERHCRIYLQALETWQRQLRTSSQLQALVEMDQEYGNIVAAWEWALQQGRYSELVRTGDSLYRYHCLRSHFHELENLTTRWLSVFEQAKLGPDNFKVWLRIATALVVSLNNPSDCEHAFELIRLVEQELVHPLVPLTEMRAELAWFYQVKGNRILTNDMDYRRALHAFQRGAEMAYGCEDPWEIATALAWLGLGEHFAGNVYENGRYAEQSLAIQEARPDQDPALRSLTLLHLGYFYMVSGNSTAGLQAVQERFTLMSEMDNAYYRAHLYGGLAEGLFFDGQFEQARQHFTQALVFADKVGWQKFKNNKLLYLILTDIYSGNYLPIQDYLSRFGVDSFPISDLMLNHVIGCASLVQGDLDGAGQGFRKYIERMQAVHCMGSIGFGKSSLAYVTYRQGCFSDTRRLLREAIEHGIMYGFFLAFTQSLALIALWLAEAGKLEEAIEVQATMLTHPFMHNSKFFDDLFNDPIAYLTTTLSAEKLEAARARGRNQTWRQASEKYLAQLSSQANWPIHLDVSEG